MIILTSPPQDLNLPEDPLPGLKGFFTLIGNEGVAGIPCLARIPQVALIVGQGGPGTGRQGTVGLLGTEQIPDGRIPGKKKPAGLPTGR